MKCTLAITQRCNLSCDYCYINKKDSITQFSTVRKIIDFIFENAQKDERIDIGFFGGEPFLEYDLMKKITALIQTHKSFDQNRVIISVTTNGTIFSEEIANFLAEKKIVLCISCDGPSIVHDTFRHFSDGSGSSITVENNIKRALKIFPFTPVNAVYSPETLQYLPEVVDYLSALGVRNIYLNPNISARWTRKEADMFSNIYASIGKKYIDFYCEGKPVYISLIDSKISVILRGGYKSLEKCKMGNREFAFAPSGNIYPCERLIGSDDGKIHCLGNINEGFIPKEKYKTTLNVSNVAANKECQICGLKDYCMNWCSCTNYFSSGSYSVVAPYICASEKASISVAFQIIKDLEARGLSCLDLIAGNPLMNLSSLKNNLFTGQPFNGSIAKNPNIEAKF
jgi:uncharacterized protein